MFSVAAELPCPSLAPSRGWVSSLVPPHLGSKTPPVSKRLRIQVATCKLPPLETRNYCRLLPGVHSPQRRGKSSYQYVDASGGEDNSIRADVEGQITEQRGTERSRHSVSVTPDTRTGKESFQKMGKKNLEILPCRTSCPNEPTSRVITDGYPSSPRYLPWFPTHVCRVRHSCSL